MIKVIVVGYGNIGKYAVDAVNEAPDMELAGIYLRKGAKNRPDSSIGVKVSENIDDFAGADVALLCTPTRQVEQTAAEFLARGINTVDSFDIHTSIWELRSNLDAIGKKHNAVSVISAGWDPGSDSVVRTLMEACAPKGITYTNFGPGMSMGHSVAVRAVEGVENAISMTIPLGTGVHRRMVYVQLADGANFEEVEKKIKTDPYFIHDETHVIKVDNADGLIDMGHGVCMQRKGVSGKTHNQLFEFNMKINNPALTAQVMAACARASMKQQPGAYTMIEIPVIDLLPGDREALIKHLV